MSNDIWDTIKVEQCILRPGETAGWVYFIACRETLRCKIGYTAGSVERRMKNLQTGAAGQLRLMAKHPGTLDTERRIHERFADQRLHGEWFEMNEELFAYICATVWNMGTVCSELQLPVEPWLASGLRMLNEELGDLPADLAKLIEEAPSIQ